MLSSFETSLCHMQGKLFEMSAAKDYASEKFIKGFMLSPIASDLDSQFNFMQWAGKEYIMERMESEHGNCLIPGELFDTETLFWIGYVYRYWHFITGESSKVIIKQAPVAKMRTLFLGYHTMSMELAIEKLKEK